MQAKKSGGGVLYKALVIKQPVAQVPQFLYTSLKRRASSRLNRQVTETSAETVVEGHPQITLQENRTAKHTINVTPYELEQTGRTESRIDSLSPVTQM